MMNYKTLNVYKNEPHNLYKGFYKLTDEPKNVEQTMKEAITCCGPNTYIHLHKNSALQEIKMINYIPKLITDISSIFYSFMNAITLSRHNLAEALFTDS